MIADFAVYFVISDKAFHNIIQVICKTHQCVSCTVKYISNVKPLKKINDTILNISKTLGKTTILKLNYFSR